MSCWSDFDPFIAKFIPDISAEELKTATLLAAVALGEDLRGFEDVYTLEIGCREHRREDHWGDAHPGFGHHACKPLHVAVPVTTGWQLNSVNGVTLNGSTIARVNAMHGARCSVYEQVCDGINIIPAPIYGGTLVVRFTVDIMPGELTNIMPEFLYTRYLMAMVEKIIQLVFEMRQLYKLAAVHEKQYTQAMRKARARRATGTAKIAGAVARWI